MQRCGSSTATSLSWSRSVSSVILTIVELTTSVGDLAWGLLRLAQQLKQVRPFPTSCFLTDSSQTSSVLQPLLNLTHLLPRGILSGAQAVFLEVGSYHNTTSQMFVLMSQVCLLEREYEAAIPLIRDIYLDVHSVSYRVGSKEDNS